MRFIRILFSSLMLLIIPLIAMPFSNQVDWTGSDFIIAGLLLLVAAFAIEVVLRLFTKKRNQVAIIAVLIFVFLSIWAELAVGVLS
ncbi:MAG: hypothetical protein HOE88_04880 [Flavobacteriales bacterium]|jgi:hypothetical protein|nr:hypothetical protein [Flavobacteriales bacterium]NCF57328.1 hypothetical protein [Bacteroidota bacterium]NCG44528.1 hypothetical protein [Pseudomonadota bacterium]MBT3572751.1 hypothetical protein [Flavobacteriales bacterium]MBT3677442.1 hypothetical protein [Flavobacteriales bacterium]